MDEMMEKFLADPISDDKQKMIASLMPMMMEMMPKMMPSCLTMMLPTLKKEERLEFILKMVAVLVEQGSVGMTEEERRDFVDMVVERASA